MKQLLIGICLFIISTFSGSSQKITNIQYQFSGNQMIITYDLSGEEKTIWRTELYLSEDEGASWSKPLKKVRGDIGDSIPPGKNKKIYWERYAENKEILKKITFLVVAKPDEFYLTNSGTFIDARTGTIYKWVRIGLKIWMAENLNIGIPVNGNTQQSANDIIEKYCYNNQEQNSNIYGGLYQWDEMMQYSGVEGSQGICPEYWHLPAESEWEEMIFFLGGKTNAYGKVKELGISHWNIRSKGTTNETGFSVLPGGMCSPDTTAVCFKNLKNDAYFWSSTERDQTSAYAVGLGNMFLEIYNFTGIKQNGYSVRCVRD